jgi:hypothetical protein
LLNSPVEMPCELLTLPYGEIIFKGICSIALFFLCLFIA